MRARVALSTLRRVEALLDRARMPGRYLVVPEIMGVDEWEAMAMAAQDRLSTSHRDDAAPEQFAEAREYRRCRAKGVVLFKLVPRIPTDIESARPASPGTGDDPPRPEGW